MEWRRGCGNPNVHTGKSNSLSPPDKSPLDKCGQAGKEPSFSSDGVQDSDKDEALLGKMGEQSKGPQAEKLSQQQCSFQLLLAKPLKKFTHRHSPYSANIGYSTHVVMCLKCNCACVHIWLHILLLQERSRWVWSRNSWSGEREEDRGNEWDRERETVFVMFIFRAGLVKKHHEIFFFTGSDRPSTMNWSPDGDLALCVVIFFSAHLPAQILDNLLAPGIPNPAIHPHSLHPCVSQHKTGV